MCLTPRCYAGHSTGYWKLATGASWLVEYAQWYAGNSHVVLHDVRKLIVGLQKDGGLEVVVPKTFTAGRPPFTFSHQQFVGQSLSNHPEASRLHNSTAGPSIQDIEKGHGPFSMPLGYPTTFDSLVRRGLPQLLLHITSFKDATFVSVVWPHTLTDASGILDMLKNWSLVLAGRETEVQPVLGALDDVLIQALDGEPKEAREEMLLNEQQLSGMSMAKWITQYLLHWARSPRLERRTIFMPSEALRRLKAQAQEEISAMPEAEGRKPFASENDVLVAWITQAVAASEPCLRHMTAAGFLNLRGRVKRLTSQDGAYIQNMLTLTNAFFTPELLGGPVGPIAVAHRRHVQAQGTEPQLLSFARAQRQDIDGGRLKLRAYGNATALPILFNNFLRSGFLQAADFAPAVVRAGEASAQRTNPPGTPTAYGYFVDSPPMDYVLTFFMLGKDHAGNCWFQANLRPRAWAELERRMRKLCE